MSSTNLMVSIGRLPTKDLLNSMSRIMDASDERNGLNVCADVKLICRDGLVKWNRYSISHVSHQVYANVHKILTVRIYFLIRFLLVANCPLLSECLSGTAQAEDAFDASAVIILPDVSCSTLSSMLKCTLNHAVRWDTLSVNEQQVMALLGFNLEKAAAGELEAETKRLPRMEVEIVEDDWEDGDSVHVSNVAISDVESGDALSSTEVERTAEAAAEAFGDIPIRSGDIKGDVDAISMMSVEGGNLLFPNGAVNVAKRSARGSRSSSSDLSLPGLADVPIMVDKSVGTDDLDRNGNNVLNNKESLVFKCVEPGCNIEFSRRQHLEQHAALHSKSSEFPCDLCKKVFYHEMSLRKHRSLHENADVVSKCPECGEGVRRGKRGLRNHMHTHHVFVRCTACDKDIPKIYVRQHARKEHPDEVHNESKENVFQCGDCLRTFKSSRALGTHKERSHKSNPKLRGKKKDEAGGGAFFKCKQCKKLFASKDHLKIHVEKQHSGAAAAELMQPCAECNGKLVRNLAEHRRNVHRADSRAGCKNLRPAPCRQCGKMFSTAYAAKYHEQGLLFHPLSSKAGSGSYF